MFRMSRLTAEQNQCVAITNMWILLAVITINSYCAHNAIREAVNSNCVINRSQEPSHHDWFSKMQMNLAGGGSPNQKVPRISKANRGEK